MAATVEISVTAMGFDSMMNPLSGTPTNGLEVYDAGGNLTGTWAVVSGRTFNAADTANAGRSSGISYNNNEKIGNTNGPIEQTTAFTSYNAAAEPADFVVIDSESLAISVSWTHRDIRWQRRDMTNATPAYDLSWTITGHESVSPDLGPLISGGSTVLNSVGVGTNYSFTGYVDAGGGANQVIDPPTLVRTGVEPSANLSYDSGAPTAGQLTGKYDGSDFNLTLQGTHTRDVNGLGTAWNEMMNGDGDETLGENPRTQMRVNSTQSYDYSLTYTTYDFIAVPEPSGMLLSALGLVLALRRKRS